MINSAYEDPEIVEGYLKKKFSHSKKKDLIGRFISLVKSGKILDLGCGPGVESYFFSRKGFNVVGLDSSKEMIFRARVLKKNQVIKPKFLIGNILDLKKDFLEDEFNAVWAQASLLHIERKNMEEVLNSISFITKNNGFVYITLRSGEGELILEDDIYGKSIKRKFSLWNKNDFLEILEKCDLELFDYQEKDSESRANIKWHIFFFRVNK